jgi:hypothetical protein
LVLVTTLADPFDLEVECPPRDRWGRPLLVPPGGGERKPYTRMSTLANYVSDQSGLATWEKRLLARGLAEREDLAAMVAALPSCEADKRDKKTLTATEKREDKAINAKLDDYIEQALEHAGRSFKANHGTAIHGFTDPGSDLTAVPDRMKADVRSWLQWLERYGIEILATEVFVVNEALQAAGSFDHLARIPSVGIVVLDKKTGVVDGKDLAFAVQLSGYAHAEVYDLDTDERRPLESLTDGERINRDLGVVAHIPLGAGTTEPYLIDLRRGLHCARLATHVRQARSLPDLMRSFTLQVL